MYRIIKNIKVETYFLLNSVRLHTWKSTKLTTRTMFELLTKIITNKKFITKEKSESHTDKFKLLMFSYIVITSINIITTYFTYKHMYASFCREQKVFLTVMLNFSPTLISTGRWETVWWYHLFSEYKLEAFILRGKSIL